MLTSNLDVAYDSLRCGRELGTKSQFVNFFILQSLNDSAVKSETLCLGSLFNGVLSLFIDRLRLRSGP